MKKATKKGAATGASTTPEEGIAVIDFGTPSTSPGKRPTGKYPFITGPGIEQLANRIIDLQEKFDAVDGPLEEAKATLKNKHGWPQFFEVNLGMLEPATSMLAQGSKQRVRVSMKNKFTAGSKKAITDLIGPALAAEHFYQSWKIIIDGDQIPPARAGAFIKDIRETMARHGVSHALEFKDWILPNANFAQKRHSVFDVKTNLEIQKIVPAQASVSTKGVK